MIGSRFQILSLDGGGLRGMFSAAVLARLEEDLDVRIVDHFDLITGIQSWAPPPTCPTAAVAWNEVASMLRRQVTSVASP